MSTGRQAARDLAEEAKHRVVLFLICVVGLSYLMSLTSSSVWVNLPAAAALIIFVRYISLDLDVRRRTIAGNKLSSGDQSSEKRSVKVQKFPLEKLEKPDWRKKVNSPAVEAAIEQFTRHLVSEWVTDLWYSRITPDRDGPEELIAIMNNALGEISSRARDINLIDILTRDIINLICNHLELYRFAQAKIGKQEFLKLPVARRDTELRVVLAGENKLHPALLSIEAEHKVLQHLVDGLISLTFKPDDLQCSFFRYTVRELLSCTVFRPILNLANPRFINEKIESLVLSYANGSNKRVTSSAEGATVAKPDGPRILSVDQFSGSMDHSSVGVELMQFRHDRMKTVSDEQNIRSSNGMHFSTNVNDSGPNSLGAQNAQVLHSTSSLPAGAGAEWAQKLDTISKRKTRALAPEHFENMWTKGRNYREKDIANQMAKQVPQSSFVSITNTLHHPAVPSNTSIQDTSSNVNITKRSTASSQHESQHAIENLHAHDEFHGSDQHPVTSYDGMIERHEQEEAELDTESSYPTEDDDNNNVTGLDSPGTRVWESKNKRDTAVPHIRHPLETNEYHVAKKSSKGHVHQPRSRTSSGRKRSRTSNPKVASWQEGERTSFLLGDGEDVLNASKDSKADELSEKPEVEFWGRIYSGSAASSSMSSISTSDSCNSSVKYPENYVLADPFLKLKCEVLGANVVRSGSATFAVYSISVTDASNNSWSIKRRFRHFEELHRRLKEKELPEYNLSLPPKPFLSSGLEVPVVQERCRLLDMYLKRLLQLPKISGSIELWDFLSVDSLTYVFSDSLSIIQTLSVNLDYKSYEKSAKVTSAEEVNGQSFSKGTSYMSKEDANKSYYKPDSSQLRKGNLDQVSGMNSIKGYQENSGSDPENNIQTNVLSPSKSDMLSEVWAREADYQEISQINEDEGDSPIPPECVPPNLSAPLLSLVDVIFQLQDGGWIRRQAFWVAKQLLQLGMGDAFDDWLIEKIQFLMKGPVIASTINRIERILWPDGIFITRHPKHKPPQTSPSTVVQKDGTKETFLTAEQQLEATRRAEFVRELIIDKAPAALVSLVGRKEYERCAQDVYFFLQSPVCLKHLAFDLLVLLLLAAFPELDDAVRQCQKKESILE